MGLRLLCLLAFCSTPTLFASDWPAWRGSKTDGSTPDTGFPESWSATENIRWKTAIPARGHSSPVVSKGRVFVTGCKESAEGANKPRVLYCLDRETGAVLWERTVVEAPLERKHKLNSFASSTPAADGERVFVTFLDYPALRVACYDYSGTKLWEKSPGEFHSVHGFSSPPILYKDTIIVNADQDAKGPLRAYIVALDKSTGNEKWRIDRPHRLRSYSPPVLIEAAGRTQIVLTGSECVTSYDPNTGRQLWIVDGPTEQFVSGVVFHQGIVFLTAGFPERWVMAIDPTGNGNVTKTHIIWSKNKEGGYVPSPVAFHGMAFVVTDEGIGSCWDIKTGVCHWRERLGRHHSGSGIIAEGKVYFVDDSGVTFVLKGSDEFELLAKNDLKENVYSSPAFSDGDIFIRGETHLFCISTKKK